MDLSCEPRFGRLQRKAVDLKKGVDRDEGRGLVAFDERLDLGDAVRQHGGLGRKLGRRIVRVLPRSTNRALQHLETAEAIGCLLELNVENVGVKALNIFGIEIDHVIER